MPVVEYEVKGLEGLLECTLSIVHSLSGDAFLWFRGASRGDHRLVPKLLRDDRSIEEVFERERRLVTRFRQRSMAYWSAGYSQTDWDHLFAMQHFGMPTRLLDWTENLFVAAHFALSSSYAPASAEGQSIPPPAVWCLDPIAWNRGMPGLSEFGPTIHVLTTSDEEIEAYRPNTTRKRSRSPVAIFGSHNSGRIVAQKGTFMVWGADTRPLEEVADEAGVTLWKLQVAGNRAQLAKDLAALGFGETMVFPELPSLATELSRTEGWR